MEFGDIAERHWAAWVWDAVRKRIAYANPEQARLWNLPETIEADSLIVSPYAAKVIGKSFEAARASAQDTQPFDILIETPFEAGAPAYRAHPLFPDNERYWLFERAKTEAVSSRPSLETAAGLVNAMPFAACLFDLTGRLLHMNDAGHDVLGDIAPGETLFSALTLEIDDAVDLLGRALAHGEASTVMAINDTQAVQVLIQPIKTSNADSTSPTDMSQFLAIFMPSVLSSKVQDDQLARRKWRDVAAERIDLAFETDTQGRLIFFTDKVPQALGVKSTALIGNRLEDIGATFDPALLSGLDQRAKSVWGQMIWHGANVPAPIRFDVAAEKIMRSDKTFGGYALIARPKGDPTETVEPEDIDLEADDIAWSPSASETTSNVLLLKTGETSSKSSALNEDMLRGLFELAGMALFALDRDGDILYANNQALDLVAPNRSSLSGEGFSDFFDAATQGALDAFFSGPVNDELALKFSDGKEIALRNDLTGATCYLLRLRQLPKGSSIAYCAVLHEGQSWHAKGRVLQSKTDALEIETRQKSDFLAQLSHELRTPLNAILGFSDIMLNGRLGPIANPQYQGYVADIHKSGQLLLSLINDILDLSRIESGRVDLQPEVIALEPLISECLQMVASLAEEKSIKLHTELHSELPEILADARSVRQIMINLLVNALKFTPEQGEIFVTLSASSNGRVKVSIRDTGIGMSEQEMELALKPYHQVKSKTKGNENGIGLGLPLAKALAEANQADFLIKSAPDDGTIVDIAFPEADAKQA